MTTYDAQVPGSPREKEILGLAAEGLTDKEIAARLGISPDTVATYWRRIRLRLGGASRTEAVAISMALEREAAESDWSKQRERLESEIQARAAAEDDLAQSVLRMYALLDSIPDGVVFEDLDRNAKFINQAAVDLLDAPYTPKQIALAKEHKREAREDLFADPVGLAKRDEQLIRAGAIVRGETIRLRDGSELERDFVPLSRNGADFGYLWILREPKSSDRYRPVRTQAALAEAAAAAVADLSLGGDVEEAVETVGLASTGEHAFVCAFDEDGDRRTHEWFAEGVNDERFGRPQSCTNMQWVSARIRECKSVVIRNPEDLPQEATMERQAFAERGIHSMIVVPICDSEQVYGLLGIDSSREARPLSVTFEPSLRAVGRGIAAAWAQERRLSR